MKVMFSPETRKSSFLLALSYTLRAIGEEVILWSPQVSAFDAFDVDKPDVLIMTSENMNKEILWALNQHPDIRIILYSSNIVDAMKKYAPPELIIVPPGLPRHVKENIEHKNVLEAEYAADLINYTHGYYMENAKSDILVLVDMTTVFSHLVLQQINSILALKDLSVKCIGYRVNTPLYIGQMSPEHISCFMKSTSLAICYSYEMIQNCIINRTFCLTPHDQPWMPQFVDDKGLIEGIDLFLETNKQKRALTKKAAKQILRRDTYFHRLAEIGEIMGIQEWSDNALKILPRFMP